MERAIWDESFGEGKVIAIGLTYVWQEITNYYVANGKMRYPISCSYNLFRDRIS